MNGHNSSSNTSATQTSTPTRPSRGTRDLIDRLLDLFHAPASPRPRPRPRSVSPSSSSASSASATDDTTTPLCAICTRRERKVRFVVCGHGACTSCTKRLWSSMRRRYGPRPLCFPCPFCRELVARVGGGLAEEGEEGERVVEWVLRVSRRARGRLEAEAEVVGRTAG